MAAGEAGRRPGCRRRGTEQRCTLRFANPGRPALCRNLPTHPHGLPNWAGIGCRFVDVLRLPRSDWRFSASKCRATSAAGSSSPNSRASQKQSASGCRDCRLVRSHTTAQDKWRLGHSSLWRGRFEPIRLIHVGREARKAPVDTVVFFLFFPSYRTYQELAFRARDHHGLAE